jgi:hypothetical protein
MSRRRTVEGLPFSPLPHPPRLPLGSSPPRDASSPMRRLELEMMLERWVKAEGLADSWFAVGGDLSQALTGPSVPGAGE